MNDHTRRETQYSMSRQSPTHISHHTVHNASNEKATDRQISASVARLQAWTFIIGDDRSLYHNLPQPNTHTQSETSLLSIIHLRMLQTLSRPTQTITRLEESLMLQNDWTCVNAYKWPSCAHSNHRVMQKSDGLLCASSELWHLLFHKQMALTTWHHCVKNETFKCNQSQFGSCTQWEAVTLNVAKKLQAAAVKTKTNSTHGVFRPIQNTTNS